MQISNQHTTVMDAFKMADEVLLQGVKGISDLITGNALINLDFADVVTIMKNTGVAHMGVGRASGEKRAEDAVKMAISSPLLETTIDGARGILINITGGPDLSLFEANSAASLVSDAVDPNANIIFGVMIDPNMKDEVSITVIATGFEGVYGTAVNNPTNLFSATPAYKGGAVTQRPNIGVNRTESKPQASTPSEVEIPWFLRDKK